MENDVSTKIAIFADRQVLLGVLEAIQNETAQYIRASYQNIIMFGLLWQKDFIPNTIGAKDF